MIERNGKEGGRMEGTEERRWFGLRHWEVEEREET
jgi:hypothetical protein